MMSSGRDDDTDITTAARAGARLARREFLRFGPAAIGSLSGTVQPGRDHWPRATSMLFAGGGIRTGQVVGASDRRGEDATERIVGRGDFLATLYRHLGIDSASTAFTNFEGRPISILPEGGLPIPELTARLAS